MNQPAEDGGAPTRPVPFISRVRLKNYKSIAGCDVRLGPLTILVGPNGSGKSNFLDALAFLGRALETTPDQAINERGGIAEIVRRVPRAHESFGIKVDVSVPLGPGLRTRATGSYEIEVGRGSKIDERDFEIFHEQYSLRSGSHVERFRVKRGVVDDDISSVAEEKSIGAKRLYLLVASAQQGYARPLFDQLRNMHFYNLALDELREPQRRSSLATLGPRGEYLGEVLGALAKENRGFKERLDAYLGAIVPGAAGIDEWLAGTRVTAMLRSVPDAGSREVVFGPDSMSDGTIRAAGVLAALFQPAARDGRIALIGIEEPEIALHPAAAGVLFDALTEASGHVQVLAASQSADLLDRDDLDISAIRPVAMRDGLTVIGDVDAASQEIVEKKFYTLGELMRGNQLTPRPSAIGGDRSDETSP